MGSLNSFNKLSKIFDTFHFMFVWKSKFISFFKYKWSPNKILMDFKNSFHTYCFFFFSNKRNKLQGSVPIYCKLWNLCTSETGDPNDWHSIKLHTSQTQYFLLYFSKTVKFLLKSCLLRHNLHKAKFNLFRYIVL